MIRNGAVILLLALSQTCETARILAVVTVPSYSHQLAYKPLWRELSLRGHKVVLMTTDPMNDATLTNLTEVDMHTSYDVLTNFAEVFTMSERFNPFAVVNAMIQMGTAIMEHQFQLEGVKEVMRRGEFDLVIGEFLAPVPLMLGEVFDCPVIGVTSMDAHHVMHEMMGNPTHPVLYPVQDIAYSNPMSFKTRLYNIFFKFIFQRFYNEAVAITEEVIKRHIEVQRPNLEVAEDRLKLGFVYTSPIFYPTRPLVPGTVNVAGLHITEASPLPKDINKFLEDASQGVVYVSFGTNVHDNDLSKTRIVEMFKEVFNELPYKVLWKLDVQHSTDKIMIRGWFPQRDILDHKNVKLFITQGGMQSLMEAVHCRVPVIGIPFLGDQFNNVLRAQDKGFGLVLYKDELTKQRFKEAVVEIIENPKYKERVVELADLMEDEPMLPLQRAVWWVEYVLRHKDLSHLKGPAASATLNDVYLLDIVAVLVAVLAVVLWALIMFVKIVRNVILRVLAPEVNKSRKKKKL